MSHMLDTEVILKELMKPSFTTTFSDSESTSSICSLSEEEMEPVKRRKLVRINRFVEDVSSNYSRVEFKLHFRMARTTANKVIDLLERSGFLPSQADGREKISCEKAFLITLWYLSTQETFRQISDRFNVTFNSAHRCLRRVLKFLLSIRANIIKWPTGNAMEDIRSGFRKRKGIDNVVGAIDGSHIEIPKPANNQDAYINRKGYHSLLLQGIVNHNKKFLDVFCGEAGSMHDARLLKKSSFYANMIKNRNFLGNSFILGDSAYPNLHWLVTPFKNYGELTREHKTFNYRVSATRVVVENAFALLKGRIRRLRKLDNIDMYLCTEIIMAGCVLHNICIDENDLIEADSEDYNQPEHVPFETNLNINIAQRRNRQQQVFNEMFNLE